MNNFCSRVSHINIIFTVISFLRNTYNFSVTRNVDVTLAAYCFSFLERLFLSQRRPAFSPTTEDAGVVELALPVAQSHCAGVVAHEVRGENDPRSKPVIVRLFQMESSTAGVLCERQEHDDHEDRAKLHGDAAES